mgnify:CR=1 FL=1
MDRYAYYVCFKCGKAYFGGEARCDLGAGAGDAFNPEELVCGGCSDVSIANQSWGSQDVDILTHSHPSMRIFNLHQYMTSYMFLIMPILRKNS